jgi:pimeloyl-ACP methyl ester carboxylesterase
MTSVGSAETVRVNVGPTELYLLRGGNRSGGGPACVVLHGIEGHEGWLTFHEALADSHTVYAPSHPGYGHTPAPDWLSSVQHQAIFYHWFLQEAGLDRVDLVGTGLGGWIAAEMAVMDSSRLEHLVLVDATGVRPQQSDMLDIFLVPWRQVIERGFVNGAQSPEYQRIYGNAPIQEFGGIREAGRTMTTRMCFKPYMHDPSLPGMLGKIRTPTLVVWGEADAIVPLECAHIYADAIPTARLHVLPQCGHFAHLDQPHELAKAVHEFLSS